MSSGKIIAEIMLGISLLSTGYPNEVVDLKDTLSNVSDFFIKPITIKKEDSISPTDFTDIFGTFDEDGNLEEYTPKKIEKNTVNIRILPSSVQQTIILQIADKSVVINPGPESLKLSLLKSLGSLQISHLDAVIFSDITSSPDNVYSLIEMGLADKIIIPAVDLEPNGNNLEILKNFNEIKEGITTRGAQYVAMKDNTKIQMDNCIITAVLPKNTYEASLIIDDEDTITFIQGNLPMVAQDRIVLPKVSTYISKTNTEVSKNILERANPQKIILTRYNQNENQNTYNNCVQKVGKENVIILNEQTGANIVSPNAKPDDVMTVNGQTNNT